MHLDHRSQGVDVPPDHAQCLEVVEHLSRQGIPGDRVGQQERLDQPIEHGRRRLPEDPADRDGEVPTEGGERLGPDPGQHAVSGEARIEQERPHAGGGFAVHAPIAVSPLRRADESTEQVTPPRVAPTHVWGPLRVHLENGVVVAQLVKDLEQRPDVAATVGDRAHICCWEPTEDRLDQVVGSPFHKRDHQVDIARDPLDAGAKLVPQLGVVDVCDDQDAG